MKKFFEGTEKKGNIFSKAVLKIASPIISAVVVAKTEKPQAFEVTSKVLKSLTGGKKLSLTDVHGSTLRLREM